MPHQQVRHPRVTQPSATRTRRYAFDLHVLGTPPAFTLSQDQTLHHECTSSLSLFETASLQNSVSKGIKCCIYHQQLVRPSVAHLRRSCSHLALLPSLPLARLYSQKNHHFQVALKTMSLLHSALVQVPQTHPIYVTRETDRLDNKKPESLSGGLGIPPQTWALPGLGLLSLNRLLSLLDV